MRKTFIKMGVFILTFIITLILGSKIMNKGENNLTMEMSEASLPVMYMLNDTAVYNSLFGYAEEMDVAFTPEKITVLDENRRCYFRIDTEGYDIASISLQVRSEDGSRLVEDSPITNYTVSNNGINGQFTLKDLIESNTEYSLTFTLTDVNEKEIYYYTKAIWSENLNFNAKLEFVKDFHERTFDREAAREITKYLETNSKLEDNRTFNKVSIYSSFNQITWGELNVSKIKEPDVCLTAIDANTASFVLDYYVATTDSNEEATYYRIKEYYRVRYTADRMYLLNFERTMNQLPDVDNMCANDKILLGIVSPDVDMVESEDGNIVVFEEEGQLYSYNCVSNKLAKIFSYYDEDNCDLRGMNDSHSIKILDVDEAGNVWFAVYGYFNRGHHEGNVGLQIYGYNSEQNTIEEEIYISYDKNYSVLKAELSQLLYMNREHMAYVFMDNSVYEINIMEQTYERIASLTSDDSLQVSTDGKLIVWQETDDIYDCSSLKVKNLATGASEEIEVSSGESIKPLGFMGEDLIYGVANRTDIVYENSGNVFFPMYKVCICDLNGNILKNYSQQGIYTVQCNIVDNQITLERVRRNEDGSFDGTTDDHIMDNTEVTEGKNTIVEANIDIYENYIQIKVKSAIDKKSLKILTPKEVVFEGARIIKIESDPARCDRYYVFGSKGVDSIYNSAGNALMRAYDIAGYVTDQNGKRIWTKSTRVAKNQIMAIKEAHVTDEKSSLAVCLDTIMSYEGISRNSEVLLASGKNAKEILEENLGDVEVLDLTGVSLDGVLYYVNKDIPVLAILDNGEAVLITGFNEFNIVVLDPTEKNSLFKKGINDSAQWFEENGNCFITYIPITD